MSNEFPRWQILEYFDRENVITRAAAFLTVAGHMGCRAGVRSEALKWPDVRKLELKTGKYLICGVQHLDPPIFVTQAAQDTCFLAGRVALQMQQDPDATAARILDSLKAGAFEEIGIEDPPVPTLETVEMSHGILIDDSPCFDVFREELSNGESGFFTVDYVEDGVRDLLCSEKIKS